MSSPSIAVLVTGDPVAEARASRGGFFDLIRAAAPGFRAASWRSYDVRELVPLPDRLDAAAVIVTGSPSSVTEGLPWMERTAATLRDLVKRQVPLLGICFGHQLLGHALGGQVAPNPRGREMGTVDYTVLRADALFGEPRTSHVNTTHVDSIIRLPVGAKVVGTTALEPHAAVRFGPSAWGVQFHPEMDAGVMRQYLDARRGLLLAEGFDIDGAELGVRDAPEGPALIERFLQMARVSTPSARAIASRAGG